MRKEKKNYLASLVITLLLWGVLAAMVMWVDPQMMAGVNYLPFLGVLFLALLFSVSLILGDTIDGVIVATGVVFWGWMKIEGIDNWLNGGLIVAIILIIIAYRWGKTKVIPDDVI